MNSNPYWHRFFVVGLALSCLLAAGCNPLTALYFLFLLPPPKVPAAFDGLKKQTVVVTAHASHTARYVVPSIDQDMLKQVIPDLTENVSKIRIADPREVKDWIEDHPDYDSVELGREFEATRVVNIEVEEYDIYEQQSTNLYRGTAKVHLQVIDVEKEGEVLWDDYVEVVFPGSRPVPVEDVSRELFVIRFNKHLCRKIATKFFSYRPDEDFTVN